MLSMTTYTFYGSHRQCMPDILYTYSGWVEGPRPKEDQRGPGERLSKRTLKHVSCININKEDAMDRSKWRS